MTNKIKYYEFTRGEKAEYKVVLGYIGPGRFIVADIVTPPNTSEALKDRVVDDAEEAMFTYISKGYNDGKN